MGASRPPPTATWAVRTYPEARAGEGSRPSTKCPATVSHVFLTSPPGFDSSSNTLAGQLRGVPVAGTLAHSFVTSFLGSEVPPDPVSTSSQPCAITDGRPQDQFLPRQGWARHSHAS
jgi:hypothetical protein